MSDQPDLYDRLIRMCYHNGPLVMDLTECQHCGGIEFSTVPQSRGFEHLECSECGEFALDQMEIPD